MSRWFRVYDDIVDDPKVQLLSPELFRTWINVLALASKHGGKLPPLQQIAFSLRVSPTDMQRRLDDLILGGLIDIQPDKSFVPHNWRKRQWLSDDSGERVKKHRTRKALKQQEKTACNADVTVTVTTPDSESDSNTESDYITVPIPLVAARESEQGKNLDFAGGGSGKGIPKTLQDRAEGLGVPVAEILGVVRHRRPKNERAYFRALAVNKLQPMLPGVRAELIADALEGKQEAYALIVAALMQGVPRHAH